MNIQLLKKRVFGLCTAGAMVLSLSACDKNTETAEEVNSAAVAAQASKQVPDGMFTNPLFANGADPWLEYWQGNYYLTTTTWTSQLVMRKSPTLDGLSTASPVNVWGDADPSRCCNFWAFEFHRLNGPNGMRWYLMYTSGVHGTLDHQHLSVLESAGDDPMGPYTYKGSMMPDSWNIDGTYLEHEGKLYLLWSEWVGDEQLNWISEMTNPWTIEGPRVVLTRPEEEWEKSGRKVNEGAEILKKDGRTFLIYSASFCDTPDYKLVMRELTGKDPMSPESWLKFPKPVFERGNGVFGPGHNGFFTSPDGTEDWIVYHGNSSESHGCGATRSVRAQKFSWNEDGTPNFGVPIPEGQPIVLPSGEDGPLETAVEGVRYKVVNMTTKQCLGTSGDNVAQVACDSADDWVVDNTADQKFRLANSKAKKFLGSAKGGSNGTALVQAAWENNHHQKWVLNNADKGLVSFINAANGETLGLSSCDASGEVVYGGADCSVWRLQPVGELAIASIQSGRMVQAEACSSGKGNVVQGGWVNANCQKWMFSHTELGFYALKTSASDACLKVAGNTIVPGANIELADCDTNSSQWYFSIQADGAVTVANRESDQLIDLANCSVAEGANFAQSPSFNTLCQQFHLRRVSL